jgi:hypothetical protein
MIGIEVGEVEHADEMEGQVSAMGMGMGLRTEMEAAEKEAGVDGD